MRPELNLIDLASLSPLLILLAGTLALLLLESFGKAKKFAFIFAMAAITLAFFAALFAPASTNALLTPWLRFDGLQKLFTLLFLLIGILSTILALAFFKRFEASTGEYYFLLLSSLFGLILIGGAADFLTLFLGLETLSISLYVLCGYMKKWDLSSEASIKYFLMGAIAASILLYGIALIYGATGTTRLDALLSAFHLINTPSHQALFLGGAALVTIGFAFKAAIVPFHVWAPDAYDGAPTPVTAFMSVGTKAGAFAAFIVVFAVNLRGFTPLWNEAIALLAYPTMIYANMVAIRQVQLRRFFAYSGISHAGIMLIPLAAETPDSILAIVFYLAIYGIATLGSFGILAFLDNSQEGVFMHDLQGLFRRSPWLASIFTLCLLTLAGIPPTAGFIAKFYVFKVGFEAGYFGLVIVGLLMSVFSAYYYLRIIALMFAEEPVEKKPAVRNVAATAAGCISLAAIVILSCFPEPMLSWIASF